LQLYNFPFKFSYLWMRPQLAFITFRWDVPVVLYRIIKYIDKIQSNTTTNYISIKVPNQVVFDCILPIYFMREKKYGLILEMLCFTCYGN